MPQLNLRDQELKSGLPYTNGLGLPRSITGSFASVYRMECQQRDLAVRLFLRSVEDQQERYRLVSEFVQSDCLPYTVTFDFLAEGIKIRGEWLPALKMDWLEGEQFDDYLVKNLHDPVKLGQLLDKFLTMMDELRQAGIAHGDLQHGNIIVCNDELRLVDYDGMFVPSMQGYLANELGHRNYQHPYRSAQHFGPYLDNFSAWIIYASIQALQIDSRLMHLLGAGDDCLLFRQADFLDPVQSPAFAALEKHDDKRLRDLGRFIRAQLKNDLQNIPFLELSVLQNEEVGLEPIAASVPAVRSGARLVRGNLPEWCLEENAQVLTDSKPSRLPACTTPEAMPESWIVLAKQAQPAEWLKPTRSFSHPSSTQPGVGTHLVGHSSPTPIQRLNPKLPPELWVAPTPREVEWNPHCGRMSEMDMINWITWYSALCFLIFVGSGIVNGGQFFLYGIFCLIFYVVSVIGVLWKPCQERSLAVEGETLFARIDDLRTGVGATGYPFYKADVSFQFAGRLRRASVSLRQEQYKVLTVGSDELILCDETYGHFVIYQFCCYHPVRP